MKSYSIVVVASREKITREVFEKVRTNIGRRPWTLTEEEQPNGYILRVEIPNLTDAIKQAMLVSTDGKLHVRQGFDRLAFDAPIPQKTGTHYQQAAYAASAADRFAEYVTTELEKNSATSA